MDKIAIKVLNVEHGKKVIKYFEDKGFKNPFNLTGCVTVGNSKDCYHYGIQNGVIEQISNNTIKKGNYSVVELLYDSFPRKMMISSDGEKWFERTVVAIVDNKAIVKSHISPNVYYDVQYYKEISPIEEILSNIDAEYQGKKFQIFHGEEGENYWLQVGTERPDTNTGEISVGKGGKTLFPKTATENQIVKIVFGLINSYVEHEAREGFKYKGTRVFNPHLKIQALATIVKDENLE